MAEAYRVLRPGGTLVPACCRSGGGANQAAPLAAPVFRRPASNYVPSVADALHVVAETERPRQFAPLLDRALFVLVR